MAQTFAKKASFEMEELSNIIEENMKVVKDQLDKIRSNPEISIGEMFQMQMLMNHMNQLSEMCASIVAASNQAIQSAASKISR